jgi:hypothetical protein
MNFISLLEVYKQDCWFQQHEATAHTQNSTMQILSEFFGGRIISRNLCPPWFLDLSLPDSYLWGFLKENVYKISSHTFEELNQNFELCISNITASDVRKRVNTCIAEHGGHFQHVL